MFKDKLSQVVEGTETHLQIETDYAAHREAYRQAREHYQKDAKIRSLKHQVYAADLQKILQLPWAPKVKDIFSCQNW